MLDRKLKGQYLSSANYLSTTGWENDYLKFEKLYLFPKQWWNSRLLWKELKSFHPISVFSKWYNVCVTSLWVVSKIKRYINSVYYYYYYLGPSSLRELFYVDIRVMNWPWIGKRKKKSAITSFVSDPFPMKVPSDS